jgi:hypothetical protein
MAWRTPPIRRLAFPDEIAQGSGSLLRKGLLAEESDFHANTGIDDF